MKLIATQDAAGCVLCHDITQIIRGVTKDARFRKGHIVTAEDIPVLLSLGKDHLYVWEKEAGVLHEDEAAVRLAALMRNDRIRLTAPKEGKIDAYAEADGLFQVDSARLRQLNGAGEMMMACRHGNTPVQKGDKLGGTRVIPLVIAAEKLDRMFAAVGEQPLFAIRPYQITKVGVITTGNEVFYGRIADTFTPVIADKLAAYGASITMHQTFADRDGEIAACIRSMVAEGAEMVLCTGGMSVDPDDKTPLAIRNSGAEIVSYGAPTLPGAMFLLAYLGAVPVLGLPGCVMYARRTVFDIVLPRLLARDRIDAAELAALGEGGLCLDCPDCHFPNCGFGKSR